MKTMKRTERVAIEEHTERRILESPMRQAFRPTRVTSPRQLPTDHDYAVSTREYQSDQPSQKLLDRLLALSLSWSYPDLQVGQHRLRCCLPPFPSYASFAERSSPSRVALRRAKTWRALDRCGAFWNSLLTKKERGENGKPKPTSCVLALDRSLHIRTLSRVLGAKSGGRKA